MEDRRKCVDTRTKVRIIVFPPFDSFLYFNLFLYTRIPHLKVLQNVLLSLPSILENAC
jgi:hypothetical protein